MSLTRPYLDMIEAPPAAKYGDIAVNREGVIDMVDLAIDQTEVYPPSFQNIVYDDATGILSVTDSTGATVSISGFITKDSVYRDILANMDLRIGQDGDAGDDGKKGKNGIDGERGCTGKKGDRGPKGYKGSRGLRGYPGDDGVIGDTGPVGDKGETGDKGRKGKKGPIGSDGDKGDKGFTGIMGLRGDRGDIGEKGKTGDKGPVGMKGLQGCQGDDGPQGNDGVQGCKGEQGKDGAQCLANSDGKPAVIQKLIEGSNITIEDLGCGRFKISCCPVTPTTTTVTTAATTVTTPTTPTTPTTVTTPTTPAAPTCSQGSTPYTSSLNGMLPNPVSSNSYSSINQTVCWDISGLGGPKTITVKATNTLPMNVQAISIKYGGKVKASNASTNPTSTVTSTFQVDPATDPCVCITYQCTKYNQIGQQVNWPSYSSSTISISGTITVS